MPDVEVSHQLVDSCAMLLVKRPADFDVIVTENLFGDILSDEARCWPGASACCPRRRSANAQTEHGTFGMYEPIHGSAPRHRRPGPGQPDRHDPVGRDDDVLVVQAPGRRRRRSRPRSSETLDAGWRTADLADPANPDDGLVVVGTTGMATAVIEALEAAVPA